MHLLRRYRQAAKAKSVDASVTDEANRLINTYTAHIPSEHDLAYLGLKKVIPSFLADG